MKWENKKCGKKFKKETVKKYLVKQFASLGEIKVSANTIHKWKRLILPINGESK